MTDLVKNLRKKNYNPCGNLTGREIYICENAVKSFFNLPFSQVMRNIVISEIGSMMPGENFENSEGIKNWSARTLEDSDLLRTVNFDAAEFENFSELERGFCKFLIHILRENRYNIFYNRLVDYCGELDEEILNERVDTVVDLIIKSKPALEGEHTFDQKAHHAVAQEIAEGSMQLLKNDGNILPIKEGAKVRCGGKKATVDGKGFYYEPTVITGCTHDMTIMRE